MTTDSFTATIKTIPVPREVITSIQGMRNPIFISHVVPDADALGSMFAMSMAWANNDCSPKVSLPADSLSQRLTFLSDWSKPSIATVEDFQNADGFVVFDTARKPRCNIEKSVKETDWSAGRPIVNVDHHDTNTLFGDVNWVVSQSTSTCELVYCLLKAASKKIAPTTASLLFAGIQTDTLGFSLPTTTAFSLYAAADLLSLGANARELGERLFRSQTRSEFDLLRVIYANTKVLMDGQLAYSYAGYDEIHHAGCTASDIDDQISVPRSLDGARIAILFTEGNRGKTRINFRSTGNVIVVDLAAEFMGGGHSQAAGAILHCGIEEAMEKVLPRAVEFLENQS